MAEAVQMEAENQANQADEQALPTRHLSEMEQPRWSVVTYESVAISNLTYAEALDWVRKLDSQKISGICIVTDEAAIKISSNQKPK
jgi:hypothetical protein